MADMRTITFHKSPRNRLLHIETDGCIINVRPGLTDYQGREVTSVEIRTDDYAGEKPWRINGGRSKTRNVRAVRLKGKQRK